MCHQSKIIRLQRSITNLFPFLNWMLMDALEHYCSVWAVSGCHFTKCLSSVCHPDQELVPKCKSVNPFLHWESLVTKKTVRWTKLCLIIWFTFWLKLFVFSVARNRWKTGTLYSTALDSINSGRKSQVASSPVAESPYSEVNLVSDPPPFWCQALRLMMTQSCHQPDFFLISQILTDSCLVGFGVLDT